MFKTISVKLKGYFIRGNLSSLQVLSFHRGIINLLDKQTDFTVSLIEKEENMTGMSILVPDFFATDISSSIEVGMRLSVSEGLFSGVETGFKPIFKINYINADLWMGTPKNLIYDPLRIKRESLLIQSMDIGDSFLSLLTDQNKTDFQIKANNILKNEVKIIDSKLIGLGRLIGLGQGLTPAGDDFITGILLAQKCFNGWILIDKSSIKNRLVKTTYAGRTLLYLAIKGSFPAYLQIFLEEISEIQNDENFLKASKKASDHGSTSGRDTIAGFYWYCGLLLNTQR